MTIAVQVQVLTSELERQHTIDNKLKSWQGIGKMVNLENLKSLTKEILSKV